MTSLAIAVITSSPSSFQQPLLKTQQSFSGGTHCHHSSAAILSLPQVTLALSAALPTTETHCSAGSLTAPHKRSGTQRRTSTAVKSAGGRPGNVYRVAHHGRPAARRRPPRPDDPGPLTLLPQPSEVMRGNFSPLYPSVRRHAASSDVAVHFGYDPLRSGVAVPLRILFLAASGAHQPACAI